MEDIRDKLHLTNNEKMLPEYSTKIKSENVSQMFPNKTNFAKSL